MPKQDNFLSEFSGFNTENQSEIEDKKDLPHKNNDQKQLDVRNVKYTEILEDYEIYIKQNLSQMNESKKNMITIFKTIMYCIIIGTFLIAALVIWADSNGISSVIAIGGTVASLISSIIIIPAKITEYLFNTNETVQFGDIIKNIQEYDKAIRDDLYKYK